LRYGETKGEPEMEEEPPKVTLTPEEQKVWFLKSASPDLTNYNLNTFFSRFSLPDKDEGFDQVRYSWLKDPECSQYLKQWIVNKKISIRIEDLQPSQWFHMQSWRWQQVLELWRSKQDEYNTAVARRAMAKERSKAAAAAKKMVDENAANMKAMAVASAQKGGGKEDGENNDDEAMKEAAGAEGEKGTKEEVEKSDKQEEKEEGEGEEYEELTESAFENLNVFGVADVLNIGGGAPLWKDFQSEDWAMTSLRFELHLLAHAFRLDANDPERPGVHLDHLLYYYNRYYRKQLNLNSYGVGTVKDLVDLVSDTVCLTSKVMESQLPAELESFGVFAMLSEEARRQRGLRLAIGDETARLRISVDGQQGRWNGGGKGQSHRPPQQQQQQYHHQGKGSNQGKGGNHWKSPHQGGYLAPLQKPTWRGIRS